MTDFKLMIPDILNEIYIAHDFLNKNLFNNQLNKIQITIATFNKNTKSRKTTLAHFNPRKTWEGDLNEIVLHNVVFTGDFNDVLVSLVHEMVHQYCYENNIKDNETNGRHNKNFKYEAEKVGLTVNKPINKNSGYTTSINLDLEELFKKIPLNHEIINSFISTNNFKTISTPKPVGQESKQNGYKYQCQGCQIEFRSKQNMNLKCSDCDLLLVKSVY